MCCYNILDTDDWVSEMISGIELLNLLYTNKINVCNILQRSNVSYEITPWSFFNSRRWGYLWRSRTT